MKAKLVSLILVLCIAVGLVPLSAGAADQTDMEGTDISVLLRKEEAYHLFLRVFPYLPQEYSCTTVASNQQTFTDVQDNAYYADAVNWAVGCGVTNGTSPTTFSPDATVTRGQAVTFLWRTVGKPAPKRTLCPFSDVTPRDYYCQAVLWALEQGITNGTSANTFSPNATLTRGHIVTFLWRAAGRPENTGASPWYTDAQTWARKSGLLDGTAVDYTPEGDCPRADVVTYLYRASQQIIDAQPEKPAFDLYDYTGHWYDGHNSNNGQGAGLIRVTITQADDGYYMDMLSSRLAYHEDVLLVVLPDGRISFHAEAHGTGYNIVSGDLLPDGETIKMNITEDNDGSWGGAGNTILLYRGMGN